MNEQLLTYLNKDIHLKIMQKVFRASYYHFCKWCFTILFPNEKYEDNFHIKLLCDVYQQEIERILNKQHKTKDIIVNIPPRSSKTLITSVCLLPWMWIKDPTLTMINISFDEDLTLLNAQYSKDIIRNDIFQKMFGDTFTIRKDNDSKGFFMNDRGGFRLSKTTGSNITGHKGVVIVVDDPQNPKTSESEAHRKAVTEYYTNALFNRLTPVNLGVRIIIMQRLHEEDLTGYLLKKDSENYNHICFPATLQDNIKPSIYAKYYKNGLFDEVRLSQQTLDSFRKTLGQRGYSGQYDQRPAPKEGAIWKKQWFDTINPLILRRDVDTQPICFYIDGAYTAKTQNDPTGILTCFKQDNYLYILDFKEVWLDFPELVKFIPQYVQSFQYGTNSRIVIEPKANGLSIIQQLRSSTHLNIVEGRVPKDDKITRANSVSAIIESRRVRLVDGTYVSDYLDKVSVFPNGTHDESTDTTVMAIEDLIINDGPDFSFV